MDRDELLGREDEAWSAFVDAFAGVPEDRRDVPGAVPGWSVKDLVWHCGYWADYVGDYLERMTAGQPAPPDQDWDEVNRLVMEDGRGMSWDEVVIAAERGRDRAREALIAMPDFTDAAGKEFGEETFEHYEEHAAEITAFAAAG
jgi:Mycothiol maleylpyruvate isomerase N-terminal domain